MTNNTNTRDVLAISLPLMLSLFSINIMTFLDRLILAQYDLRAMNGAFVAWLSFSIFQYGAVGIASICEVFVGQYNGAKQTQFIGASVWQMIWFSLFTVMIFWPCGIFFGETLIPNPECLAESLPYFKCLMFFGPTFPMVTALASFFVGRGHVKFVMFVTIFSNIVNVILDFILIFGIEGLLGPMGAFGAALATGVAQLIQIVLLLMVFQKKNNQIEFGTKFTGLKFPLFKKMLNIGLPNSISSVVECAAWSILAGLLLAKSEFHLTLYSVGDSIFTLMAFNFLGLQRGITAIVSNLIGSRKEQYIGYALRSVLKIVFVIMFILALPLLFFSEYWIDFFLNQEHLAINSDLHANSIIALRWLWLYLLLDAISWQFSGVLTAAGDTKFVMFMNCLSAWFFSLLPTYICLRWFEGSPVVSWILFAFYGCMNMIFFVLRYRRKNAYQVKFSRFSDNIILESSV